MGMAGGYFISAIIGSILGWRYAFLIWGIVGIALSISNTIFVLKPLRIEKNTNNDVVYQDIDIKQNVTKLGKELNLRVFLFIIAIVALSGALWSGVSSFLVVYINEIKGATLVAAGGLAMISYTIGSLAQLIGGELSDKVGRRPILLVGFGLFSITLFLFTLPYTSGPLVIALFVSALGFSFFITQSPLAAIIGDISLSKRRGLSYGINFMVKYGIGGFAPGIAGYLATKSMNLVFYFFALISAATFFVIILSNYVNGSKDRVQGFTHRRG